MKRIKFSKLLHFLYIIFFRVNIIYSQKIKKRTIFIVGDSIADQRDISEGGVERGWGQMLENYFNPEYITLENAAWGGRSSKSYIIEGLWGKILKKIRPGDFVIIQFGHNDEKKDSRYTEPGTTFDYYLSKYCNETRKSGGIPILMNCVVRRNFGKNKYINQDDESLRNTTFADGGKVEETDILVDTHGDYRLSPKNVAQKLNVYFIDANKITHELEQGLGIEGSKKLHMWYLPGEIPSELLGKQDNTHYNIYGAEVVTKLLAEEIFKEVPELRKYKINNDLVVLFIFALFGNFRFFEFFFVE